MNILQQTAIFAQWLDRLADLKGRVRIAARINAAQAGNFGDCAPVGEGVCEMRIDFGPGYRAYYMREGAIVYLLLCGGDKSSQKMDIRKAHQLAREVRAQRPDGTGDTAESRPEVGRKAQKGRIMTKTDSLGLTPFDAAHYLSDEEAIAEFLNASIELDDPAVLLNALATVARARSMTQLANDAGLGRESLYKALAPGAKPRYDTVMRLFNALGVGFKFEMVSKQSISARSIKLPKPAPLPIAKPVRGNKQRVSARATATSREKQSKHPKAGT